MTFGYPEPKPPCLFPQADGSRCCECSTCHSYGTTPEMQRDDAIVALYEMRAVVLSCAEKLRIRGNDEPRAVAETLERLVQSRMTMKEAEWTRRFVGQSSEDDPERPRPVTPDPMAGSW